MQKYFDAKGSNTERHKRLCTSRSQNDALEAARKSQRAALRIEKFKTQSEEILMRSVLNLRDSLLSLFF